MVGERPLGAYWVGRTVGPTVGERSLGVYGVVLTVGPTVGERSLGVYGVGTDRRTDRRYRPHNPPPLPTPRPP